MRAYARIHGVGYMFGPFIAGSPEPVSIRTQLANCVRAYLFNALNS
jgi:hypothetical protein